MSQVQQLLLSIVAKHKARQHECNELIFSRIQAISNQFVANNQCTAATLADDIDQLRSVVSLLGVQNITTAEQLSATLVLGMTDYATNHKNVVNAASSVLLKDPTKRLVNNSVQCS